MNREEAITEIINYAESLGWEVQDPHPQIFSMVSDNAVISIVPEFFEDQSVPAFTMLIHYRISEENPWKSKTYYGNTLNRVKAGIAEFAPS